MAARRVLMLIILLGLLLLLVDSLMDGARAGAGPARTALLGLAAATAAGLALLRRLRQAEEYQHHLVAVLDATTDLIAIADEHGDFIYVNTAWRRFVALADTASVSELRFGSIHTPWSLEKLLREAMPAARQDGSWRGETAFVRHDGQEVPMSQVVTWHKAENGQAAYRSTIARDITAHKAVEAELLETQAQFRSAIRAMQEGFMVQDKDGRLLMANTCAEEILGVSPEGLIGSQALRPGWRIVHEDGTELTREEHPSRTALHTGQAQPGVVIGLDKPDAPRQWLTVSTAPLMHPGEATPYAAVTTFSDVTAQKAAADALRQAEERLRGLYQITAATDISFEEKLHKLLQMGCEQFGMEAGLLGRLDDVQYELVQAYAPNADLPKGLTCNVQQTFCREAMLRDEPFCFGNATQSGWHAHPAYAAYGTEAYLGTKVYQGSAPFGALCFISSRPHDAAFSEPDKDLLQLMAHWVSHELERHQAEAELQESKKFAESIADQSTSIIYVLDLDTLSNVYSNRDLTEFLGYTAQEVQAMGDKIVPTIVHPDGLAETLAHFEQFQTLADGEVIDFEQRIRHASGEWRWIWNRETVFNRHPDGRPRQIMGTAHDVTERKQVTEQMRDYSIVLEFQKGELEKTNTELEAANARLAALAATDSLTGLSNRRALQEQLTSEFFRARRYGSPLSLIMLDVDHFKKYNDAFGHPVGDAFGHPVGDAVLQIVAQTLQANARETDLPTRYGGEEFAVVLPETDADGAMVVAERVRAALENALWPLRPVTASVGVATLSLDITDPAALITAADEALYASKAGGRNRVTQGSAPLPPSKTPLQKHPQAV